jgi:hypothetical protein
MYQRAQTSCAKMGTIVARSKLQPQNWPAFGPQTGQRAAPEIGSVQPPNRAYLLSTTCYGIQSSILWESIEVLYVYVYVRMASAKALASGDLTPPPLSGPLALPATLPSATASVTPSAPQRGSATQISHSAAGDVPLSVENTGRTPRNVPRHPTDVGDAFSFLDATDKVSALGVVVAVHPHKVLWG